MYQDFEGKYTSYGSNLCHTAEDGKQYTSEQMQLVQRILRTKELGLAGEGRKAQVA
jgi:hypothetical protein